jgi:hypothetical protein
MDNAVIDTLTPSTTPAVPPVEDKETPTGDLETVIKERLQPIKEKLDNAFTERDAALARVRELEEAARKAELERLRTEGKEKEALEMERDQLIKEREQLTKRNIELTRDNLITAELSNTGDLAFKSDKARAMAFQEISESLICDDKGVWVTKDGLSLKDAVSAYLSDEANSFMLVKPVTKGNEFKPPKPSDPSATKRLADMPQSEVLRLAREGKLP